MKIHSLLSEDTVMPELAAQERDAVIEEMVQFLKSKEKIVKDKDLYDKLMQREKLGSTAIGEGIAIPHCKLKELTAPLVALAVSRKGVPFEAIDGKPTYIFFLVVSSPDNPSLNLQILAAIAQLVRKSSSLSKKILGAKTPRKIWEVVREEEEKFNE